MTQFPCMKSVFVQLRTNKNFELCVTFVLPIPFCPYCARLVQNDDLENAARISTKIQKRRSRLRGYEIGLADHVINLSMACFILWRLNNTIVWNSLVLSAANKGPSSWNVPPNLYRNKQTNTLLCIQAKFVDIFYNEVLKI